MIAAGAIVLAGTILEATLACLPKELKPPAQKCLKSSKEPLGIIPCMRSGLRKSKFPCLFYPHL